MEFERKRRKISDLRVVPLIDVVFFLIFYFLLAGSVQQITVVPVDPPLAKSGEVLNASQAIFTFGRYQEILFNDEPVADSELEATAKHALKGDKTRVVTLHIDAALPATRLIDIVDRLKAAGVRNLSLLTQAP